MFGALRLECALRAPEHREDLLDIQVEIINGKGDHKSLSSDIGIGMPLTHIILLVDGMITQNTCKI